MIVCIVLNSLLLMFYFVSNEVDRRLSYSEGSVRVDFNLEHTYYLDRSFPGHEALRRILVSELSRGKLGIYSASMENFVFEHIGPLAEGNGLHSIGRSLKL